MHEVSNPFGPYQSAEERPMFFDRHEPIFERYVVEVLALPADAPDLEIAAAMEIELKTQEVNGVYPRTLAASVDRTVQIQNQ